MEIKVVEKKVKIEDALLLDNVLGEFLDLHMDTEIMFDLSDCKLHLEKILKNFRDSQPKIGERVIAEMNVKLLYDRAIKKINSRGKEGSQPLTDEEAEIINKVNQKVNEEVGKLKNKIISIKIPQMTKEVVKDQMEKYQPDKYDKKAFVPTIKQIAVLQRLVNLEEEKVEEKVISDNNGQEKS